MCDNKVQVSGFALCTTTETGDQVLPCVVPKTWISCKLYYCADAVLPFGYATSISSSHDSCFLTRIGQLSERVPDLLDGAYVARLSWLVYILSNMRLWGTKKMVTFFLIKCQTVEAGHHLHCTGWDIVLRNPDRGRLTSHGWLQGCWFASTVLV